MNIQNIKGTSPLLNGFEFEDDFSLGMSFSSPDDTKQSQIPFLQRSNQNQDLKEERLYKNDLIKFKHDIALIKESGISNFRFTLSWSKIIPDGLGEINKDAIASYNQVFEICKENGLEPFVSLYESELPLALQNRGGWTNRDCLDWFENYVEVCIRFFNDKVNYWVVFNAPSVFTGASGFFSIYPSGKNRINIFLSVLHHTLLCQAIGFNKIKQLNNAAFVGVFFSGCYCVPISYSEKDLKATERIDTLLNRLFIEPSLGMDYPIKTLPFLKNISKHQQSEDQELIKVNFDFIGLQNCTQEIIAHDAFIPYLNAKIIDFENLRIKKNHLQLQNHQELLLNLVKKYSQYKGINKIFIDENLFSVYEPVH